MGKCGLSHCLLLGLGHLKNEGSTPKHSFPFEVGGQLSYKFIYTNIGYGIVSLDEVIYGNDPSKTTMIGAGIASFGAMISFGKTKRFFVDINGCFTFKSSPLHFDNIGDVNTNYASFNLGICYRIGNYRSK